MNLKRILVFAGKRLGSSLIVLFGVAVLVFFMLQLVPGDPVRAALGTRYTEQSYLALRHASGLDRPLGQQFLAYITSAARGDLGVSFRTGQPVTVMLMERFPASLSLGLVAIVIGLLIALPAGIWSALKEGKLSDAIVRIISQVGVSIPDFWMGVLLILLFSATLGLLPSSGYVSFGQDPAGWVRSLILPAATSGLVAAAIMTRYVRSAVLDVKNSGYVRTARSKGLSPRSVLFGHVVRGALVPILTITGVQLATILSGLIVVEAVFAWPGIGSLVKNSVDARDYPVIQGVILLVAAVFLLVNLLVDVLYAVVDPRIRLS
jgi:peptide/nickel transport system permease protein